MSAARRGPRTSMSPRSAYLRFLVVSPCTISPASSSTFSEGAGIRLTTVDFFLPLDFLLEYTLPAMAMASAACREPAGPEKEKDLPLDLFSEAQTTPSLSLSVIVLWRARWCSGAFLWKGESIFEM